jgi:uncharacterized protein (DUF697 family)
MKIFLKKKNENKMEIQLQKVFRISEAHGSVVLKKRHHSVVTELAVVERKMHGIQNRINVVETKKITRNILNSNCTFKKRKKTHLTTMNRL